MPTARVFHTPGWKNLEALTPRVYFRVTPERGMVRLSLKASGEGFKGAVVYDSRGNVSGALERFIDFGDEKAYTYELAVKVPASETGKLWGLDLQNVSVADARGLEPYFSTSPASYFKP